MYVSHRTQHVCVHHVDRLDQQKKQRTACRGHWVYNIYGPHAYRLCIKIEDKTQEEEEKKKKCKRATYTTRLAETTNKVYQYFLSNFSRRRAAAIVVNKWGKSGQTQGTEMASQERDSESKQRHFPVYEKSILGTTTRQGFSAGEAFSHRSPGNKPNVPSP